jgi:hypothetical protein
MATKTRNASPSPIDFGALDEQVVAVTTRMAKITVRLSPPERLGARKPRVGTEQAAARLTELARRRNFKLADVPLDQLTAGFVLAAQLQPIRGHAKELSKRMDDTILHARSTASQAYNRYYRALLGLAVADPELEADLREVAALIKAAKPRRPKSKAPTPTTK